MSVVEALEKSFGAYIADMADAMDKNQSTSGGEYLKELQTIHWVGQIQPHVVRLFNGVG